MLFQAISQKIYSQSIRCSLLTQVRCSSTLNIDIQKSNAYFALSRADRASYVPKPSATINSPEAFLKAIGRSCETVAPKFTSWDSLFTATSSDLKTLGIKSQMRKYILGWREWYCRGVTPRALELPKRQKKYLKIKEKVKQARLEKLGMS
ncbi:hypothetical protein BATDEDRAFT_87714 [Batrachochytrium dendrobatidis JAM81]|uniref:Small ribosomal subunit protein mS41 n=2 Tax=Batrachochytrium dendrobatidis TaxID=109871 RepID=F4P027_BATDJ|nr:uncharacterized protein BATDEDRAFT_87714 [Batrachochytrium dendrobatidis JAM81]KAJ8326047.1 telomere length regulation protein [Batrachochytrium dendrobatidis]OAJ38326.1 hypothetical protein BDEG_22273 [Batrachochytrium dendrobatidis JEL423]EGF81499.1 hypothetical protein BATDEDRAFT_87714 [Batrachochytrium dendrobatidis JAM81]KAK5669801.1 telomere length regulation protein [Batrachochytrium dendrobatidis]KAK5670006.1 telomere length regulation protein [Batrachochytrium dendrobatidis]|eukprot:XP_006678224.1 hypothetical protein BATDEDRAFT_87714 [Batrachochytrium dendrobatidis JAM81]